MRCLVISSQPVVVGDCFAELRAEAERKKSIVRRVEYYINTTADCRGSSVRCGNEYCRRMEPIDSLTRRKPWVFASYSCEDAVTGKRGIGVVSVRGECGGRFRCGGVREWCGLQQKRGVLDILREQPRESRESVLVRCGT